MCRFMEIGFVTVFAGDPQRLVADRLFAIPGFCRVAFRARDAGMGSAQCKSRARAVIERRTFPGLRVMARLAPRCSPPGELTEVRILMAAGAHRCDACIPDGVRFLMTLRTLDGGVLPFKRECGFAVIKEQ